MRVAPTFMRFGSF
jgi:serine/tyrosine/threonine adenylyltransferase